jgi:hypothetical protein
VRSSSFQPTCQLLHVTGFPRANVQAFFQHHTCRLPRQSTFASSLTCWFTRAEGEHIPHQRHVLLISGCGWTATSPCVLNRTCYHKFRMTILHCLLTDCGLSSLHRTLPSLHSNHWIPQLIACSNLRSFRNSEAARHLCCQCTCCLSRPLPTPSTCELQNPKSWHIYTLISLC